MVQFHEKMSLHILIFLKITIILTRVMVVIPQVLSNEDENFLNISVNASLPLENLNWSSELLEIDTKIQKGKSILQSDETKHVLSPKLLKDNTLVWSHFRNESSELLHQEQPEGFQELHHVPIDEVGALDCNESLIILSENATNNDFDYSSIGPKYDKDIFPKSNVNINVSKQMNDTESKWNLYLYTPVDALGELTNLITKTHFPQYTCVGVITEGSTGIMDYVPHSNFRFHIHIGDDSPISKLEETAELDYNKLDGNTLRFEELLIVSLDAGCPFYVVQVSNPKAAVHCFARASRRAQFRSSRKYLFLPMFKNGEIVDLKEEIFLMKEMDYFPDLVIAKLLSQEQDSQDSDDNLEINSEINSIKFHYKIELYTHQFKGREKSKILLVDTWRNNENSLRSMNIFPDKVRNVEGREVIIVTWYYAPFIVLNFNKRPPLYDGIEFRVAREFLIFVNASVRITMDPNNYWGDAFDNGTGNGVLGLMAMDKGDVGFSAFYAWPSSFKVVDFSNTHMRSSVSMMAPRPKLKPGWLMPIMPFSGAMWMAVGACYLGATFTLYKFQNFADKLLGRPGDAEVPFSKLDYTALWLFAMLMSQGPDYKLDSSIPRQVPTRHFIAWFLVIGEVICDTYSAGLAYVLSTPRFEPPIEWVEDLWTRHVIWAGNHVAWIWSIEEDESPMLKDITANFRVMTEESMNATGRKSGDIAFGIERLQGGHFTTESHINEGTVAHRRIMKDTLYWSHLYFLLRKGSPYKQHFNTLVNRLREAGLLLYWEGDVIRHYMSERLQVAISTSRILHDEDGANKLTLNQLQGAFFLLILGGILGTIAFAAELIVRPEKKQQMKLNSNDEKSVNGNKLRSTRLN